MSDKNTMMGIRRGLLMILATLEDRLIELGELSVRTVPNRAVRRAALEEECESPYDIDD